ncbi:MAG: methylenetetrahydrofolate reductase [Spirochaetes bacterium]|nr:methylenetetrahydrofolate reductase [Spirochaetota bacterium]
MSRFREKVVEGKEFIITCEFVPGRGSRGKSVEEVVEFGKKVISGKLPIHAISITDNPGGNPAIGPDILGKELYGMGLDSLIHFATSDCNRNMIESRAYSLARDGIENLLVVTGDYTASGYGGMAKPVFDLDSVQVVRYLKEMNKGLKVPGRKKGTFNNLPETNFFTGSVVSPFKRTESELMTQFFKLEKKVWAGADFIIPQLGYDVRKFAEVLKYMKFRNINLPILGNVYVLNRAVARFMNKGNVPGCVVTDELVRKIEEDAKEPDKGKKARLERAAQLMSIFRGMGFNGVHIGGFGLKYEDFEYVIKSSEEIADNWRKYIPNFRYSQENEFFCFPDDPELTFDEDKLVPVKSPRKHAASLNFRLGLILHRSVFTERTLGYKIMKLACRVFDKWKFAGRISYFFERVVKKLLYNCQECGDCALFDMAYLCPMSRCAKFQRNGPCGGSRNGMCEVDDTKRCVWTMVYDRLSSVRKTDEIRGEYVPPVNWTLSKTSSWLNYFLGRDHSSKKINIQNKDDS